jgi:hypothetical protein
MDIPQEIQCGWDSYPSQSHIMARGVFQHYDIDYEKTFSPVMKIISLRLLIALVATYDLEIH